MDLELDNVVDQEQQQQPTKPSGEMLSTIKKDTTEKIVGTIVTKDDNPLQDPQDTSMVASQPDAVVALGPQLRSPSLDGEDEVGKCLLVMAHAHLHAAMALMKEAGLTPQEIAEDLYVHADIQATIGIG